MADRSGGEASGAGATSPLQLVEGYELLTGGYERTVDEKGRIVLPAGPWREAFAAGRDRALQGPEPGPLDGAQLRRRADEGPPSRRPLGLCPTAPSSDFRQANAAGRHRCPGPLHAAARRSASSAASAARARWSSSRDRATGSRSGRLDVANRPTAAEYDALDGPVRPLALTTTAHDHCSRPLKETAAPRLTRRSPRGQRCAVRPPAVLRTADGRPLLRPLTISSIGETSRRAPAVRGTADGRTARQASQHRQASTTGGRSDVRAPTGHGRRDRRRACSRAARRPASTPPSAAAGHAAALLEAHPHLVLVGLDRDDVALAAATAALAPFDDRVTLRRARFDELTATLQELGHDEISRRALRPRSLLPAARRRRPRLLLPTTKDHSTCAGSTPATHGSRRGERLRRPTSWPRVLRTYGDERFATRIARAIVAARPLQTTTELADVVRDAIPAPPAAPAATPPRAPSRPCASRSTTSSPILADSLDQAIDFLAPGGRCAVLAYHSGEDRIVKERFRHHATGGVDAPARPAPARRRAARRPARPRPCPRRPRRPRLEANPRAESARLRVVEKLFRRAG